MDEYKDKTKVITETLCFIVRTGSVIWELFPLS